MPWLRQSGRDRTVTLPDDWKLTNPPFVDSGNVYVALETYLTEIEADVPE